MMTSLREVLYRHVPRALVERPKQGFQLPMGDWLRGPLRPWAEERLDPLALATVPLLDPAPIRRRWQAHCDGQADWSYPLWAILVLMDWQARWRATIA
jgi:asparagine synthase (glutamine-hydrolysing)